jgi:hypothetical protein
VNVENIKRVRDHIASLPEKRFAMQVYFGERDRHGMLTRGWSRPEAKTNRQALEGSCGSCACIAGHAMAVLEPDAPIPDSVLPAARRALGLGVGPARRLFEPNNHDAWFMKRGIDLSAVTQAQAVLVLDHLLNTGKVDWSVARSQP